MAVNLTKVLSQIETRHAAIDSNTDATEHTRLDAINDRINAMGGVLTYRSTGHLPTITDSAYIGTIAYVAVDNVFGDSSGAFYMATFRDSGWVKVSSLQDSDEGAIAAPGGGTGPVWQGTNYGHRSGGDVGSFAARNDIQKYSFTSDGNGTDVGDLNAARSHVNGGSSTTHGYAMGGTNSGSGFNGDYQQNIQKWTFASDANASAITATLTANRIAGSRGEISDNTHSNIYVAGGFTGSTAASNQVPPDAARVATIDKFDVSSDTTNATDQGDMTEARYHLAGHSSSTHGYVSGGSPPAAAAGVNNVEKFPFAAAGNATDVGDLTAARRGGGGTSSTASGYHAGAYQYHPNQGTIDKFPFASDANATDVGDVNTTHTQHATTSSSTTHGYHAGAGAFASGNSIEKYSFTSDGNATDVGDLPVTWWGAGSSAHY